MILAAVILLFLGALLHSWYGGNYRAKSPGDVSMAFILYRNYVISFGIAMLLAGLVLLWIAKGFLWVIAGAIAYWFVLPMLTVHAARRHESSSAIHASVARQNLTKLN